MRRLIAGCLLAPSLALADGNVEGTLRVTRGGVPVAARYALVFVKGYAAPGSAQPRRLGQSGRTFDPPVLALVRGQSVEFSNDELTGLWHHVFSLSEPQKFDLGRYQAPERRRQAFYREGRVDVFCDIHKEMFATLWVLPNPSFVLLSDVDARGTPFKLERVRAGAHTLVAWDRLGTAPVEVPVTVKDGATTRVELTLELGRRPLESLLADHGDARGHAYTDANRKKEQGDW